MESIEKNTDIKPKDTKEFVKWVKNKFNIEINEQNKFNFEQNSKALLKDVEDSLFWRNIILNLNIYNDAYKIGKNLNLLLSPNDSPEFISKKYKDFLSKVYRKNCIENKNWPYKPKDDWILPNNWFERIKDIVRTTIVVKYLDGVEFIIEKIRKQSEMDGLVFSFDYEARDEGYYAAHINISSPFRILDIDGKSKEINFNFEIQITTQLQDVLRTFIHKYYEERRKRIEKPDTKWQWDYKSEEFAPNYLGHILHYIEGMIMEIRNKQIK